jgi:RNA polymerase sigma-70 factor (ECF subfamily)
MLLSSYRRPYERRTGAVRPLWVFISSLGFHTGGMAFDPDAKRSTNDGLTSAATVPTTGQTFEEVVLPHLDAAYRLARWLMRDDPDAEDVVQEASLRAFRYIRTFTGGNGRAWFLRIVRNTSHGWRGRNLQAVTDPFDEEQHSNPSPVSDPERLLLQTADVALIQRAIGSLPTRFRELLVLRELEGLSYRELADVMSIPIGTVMSSLSRARQALRVALHNQARESAIPKRTQLREAEAVLACR